MRKNLEDLPAPAEESAPETHVDEADDHANGDDSFSHEDPYAVHESRRAEAVSVIET